MYTTILKTGAVSGSPEEYKISGNVYDTVTDKIIEHHINNNIFLLPGSDDVIPLNIDEITHFGFLSDEEITIPPVPEYRDITKEDAVNAIMVFVEYKKSLSNKQPFMYGDHMYEADVQSIQATQNQCVLMGDDDQIPVTYGKWKSLDTDGVMPVYIDFTVYHFKQFAKTLFDRGVLNFGVKEQHRQSLYNLLIDENVTIDDIFNYDYTLGWI